jgi:class II lanthipeptide synthase
LGLYAGCLGILFAGGCIGRIVNDDKMIGNVKALLDDVVLVNSQDECDLISGKAGAIVALLALSALLEDMSLLECAVRLGDEVLGSADKSPAGYSWKSSSVSQRRNLTGLSHGAAGIGFALLELFIVTGESKYRRGADLAFAYERYWFDARAGNWPDFREESSRDKRSKQTHSGMVAWCHGAPGIALSRLRAYEISGEEVYKSEALIALRTTYDAVDAALHSGVGNYSLCHGLLGNAEVLLWGCQVLGDEFSQGMTLSLRVAKFGVESYGAPGGSWPCGTHVGETPSLMVGLAGIGYFYLRMLDPRIPSILLLRWARQSSLSIRHGTG